MNEQEKDSHRLYNDLAWLWPLWGDVEDYREECEKITALIREFARGEVRSLLDIGCGGGKNSFHLKKSFAVTGIDISEPMLSNAQELNPECTFHVGDMRTLDLGMEFDSAYLNDSVAYMTTKEDLAAAFESGYKHLRPGGVMVVFAEYFKESYSQNKTMTSTYQTGDIEITFVENNYDPDPEDDTHEATFIYLLREKGKLRIEHDFHLTGLFSIETWRESLKAVGFEVTERMEQFSGQDMTVFVCVKPL